MSGYSETHQINLISVGGTDHQSKNRHHTRNLVCAESSVKQKAFKAEFRILAADKPLKRRGTQLDSLEVLVRPCSGKPNSRLGRK
jgi:hypothetical protein